MHQVGIVGCGVVGKRFADAVANHGATTLSVACDLDGDRAAEMADAHDAAAVTDHADLVGRDGVDIVYVGVPPLAHREVVADALAAGKHVVCEKPIAEDAATGEEMVDLAAEADATTAVNLPFRYTPGFVELRERVAAGDIGEPRRVELRFRFPRWPRAWQDVDWLRTRAQGGPMREVGTHFLFGVQELFGPIESVSARVEHAGPELYESDVVGYFAVDGVGGTVDLLTDHEGEEENVITVVGDEGSLALTEWYRLHRDRGHDTHEVVVDDPGDTTGALVDEVVADIEDGDGDLVSFAEATQVQAVLDGLFASDGDSVAVERVRDR